jgi:diguanylate cyclase (GGDEF)-like protein
MIVAIGKLLRKHVREIGVLSRYGGEEFLIVLPETDGQQAEIVAERPRSAVEKADFWAPVTLSIGVATYPKDASSAELTIRKADSRPVLGEELRPQPRLRGAACGRIAME